MLNRVILAGRMARDPELRRTQSGTPVTSFTLAVDRDFKDQNGEKPTDWIDCVAWKGSAEFVSRYFQKGDLCIVDGRLQVREWTDKDGNNRRTSEVSVNSAYFGNSKTHANMTPGSIGEQPVQFDELEGEDLKLPF